MSQYINLYREGARAQAVGRHGFLLLAAIGLLLLLGSGSGVWLHLQVRDLEQQLALEGAKVKTAQARLAEAARRVGGAGAAARISELEARLKQREALLSALDAGALGDMNGYAEYLRALGRQAGKGVWITSFEVARGGTFLSISGRSLDGERLPAYLSALNGEKVFQGRKFASLKAGKGDAGKTEGGAARESMGLAWVDFTLGSELPLVVDNPVGGTPDLVSMVASGKPPAVGGPSASRPPAPAAPSAAQSTAAALGALAGAAGTGGGSK